jgi:hypothetical protein
MSSSTTRSTALYFYTAQGWTLTKYTYPTTTQLYTIIVESTPIATIRLLPFSAGGGILLPNNLRLQRYNPPATVDHALLAVEGYVEPTLIYSRIYGLVGSGPLSIPLLPSDTSTFVPPLSTTSRVSTPNGQTSLSTSSITPTGPTSTTDSTSISNADPLDEPDPNNEGVSKLNGGMIAGISIGAIVGLLIIMGLYIIVWRRKRARKNTNNESDDALAKRESDKMVVSSDEALYQSGAHHMSYRDHTQELDSSHPRTFNINAHELQAYAMPGELSRHHYVGLSHASPTDSTQDDDIEPATQDALITPSLHVEAQRIRELEWLDREEAKLRQRREQLMRQSGEHSSRPGDSQ